MNAVPLTLNRENIISEIQKTAKANGGLPLGRQRFERETGINRHAWFGKYWPCWSEALREAGFQPNKPRQPHEPSLLIEKLVALTRSLGRVPIVADLVSAAYRDPTFPCRGSFTRRLGHKSERIARILAFCQENPGHDDVAALWKAVPTNPGAVADSGSSTSYGGVPLPSDSRSPLPGPRSPMVDSESSTSYSGAPLPSDSRSPLPGPRSPMAFGYVYLLKHGAGREYKIGRTIDPLRREGEVALAMPDEVEPVHYIKTDDPAGIERYWHDRFKTKRKRREWFALTVDDVRAFKRWKRIH